jgi:hypothetical protein
MHQKEKERCQNVNVKLHNSEDRCLPPDLTLPLLTPLLLHYQAKQDEENAIQEQHLAVSQSKSAQAEARFVFVFFSSTSHPLSPSD